MVCGRTAANFRWNCRWPYGREATKRFTAASSATSPSASGRKRSARSLFFSCKTPWPRSRSCADCCPSVLHARGYAMTKGIGNASKTILRTVPRRSLPTAFARNVQESSTLISGKTPERAPSSRLVRQDLLHLFHQLRRVKRLDDVGSDTQGAGLRELCWVVSAACHDHGCGGQSRNIP